MKFGIYCETFQSFVPGTTDCKQCFVFLFRWRFVVHGAIDGFSRLIVFLAASDNNRQETVLSHFLSACNTYGLPSRIRVDDGGENNSVCSVIELLRGSDHHAAIRGSSVHNQRIERLWRDMWNGVTNVYYRLFYLLEDGNALNCDNENHLWALHYVFLPRINSSLVNFINQWNNHGIRTQHGHTPMQLYVSQALNMAYSGSTAIRDIFRVSNDGSADNAAIHRNVAVSDLLNVVPGQPNVLVPRVQCPLSDSQLVTLNTLVGAISSDADPLGVTAYLTTVAFIDADLP